MKKIKEISVWSICIGCLLMLLGIVFFSCGIPPPESIKDSEEFIQISKWSGISVALGIVFLIVGVILIAIPGKGKRCTCPKECDCQNPPPDDPKEYEEEGVWHVSMFCPVHNDDPDPDPDCPIHGHDS